MFRTFWKAERLSTSSSSSSRRCPSNKRSLGWIWRATSFWPVRVLLDENLPRALVAELTGHYVRSVQAEGWSGTKNGALLLQAGEHFDALLSMDRGFSHQQNLRGLGLRVLIVQAPSNRIVRLRPLVDGILQKLDAISPG